MFSSWLCQLEDIKYTSCLENAKEICIEDNFQIYVSKVTHILSCPWALLPSLVGNSSYLPFIFFCYQEQNKSKYLPTFII